MPLHLSAPGWRRDVVVASTFLTRLKGLRPRAAGRAMLIAGRSVHGLGMREPLAVAALDGEGVVLDVGRLEPRRGWFGHRDARWILELPPDEQSPARGTTVKAMASRDTRP